MLSDEFIGKGWSFPPIFRDESAELVIARRNKEIIESLKILFTTLPGERIAHPLFGCNLQQYMFHSIGNSLLADLRQTITNAVTLFETRIQLTDVVIKVSAYNPNTLDINIMYQLNHTNSRFNMVIPFNLLEGVSL